MDEAGDAEALMGVQVRATEPARTQLAPRVTKALGASVALLAGAFALWSWTPSASSASTNAVQVLDEAEEQGSKQKPSNCLCLFDVDRTLTARQHSTADECPGTNSPSVQVDDGHGGTKSKIPWDVAYGTGPLVLSEVGNNLDQTFCSQDRCHMGIVTAGTASYDGPDEERGQIFARLDAASHGYAGDGSWSQADQNPPASPLVFSCPDPHKVECAKQIVDWLNNQGAGIPAENVYFFDDHRGNAGEMDKYGYNAREVSCKSRDLTIGNGIVGKCGARLNEIVKVTGVKTCWQLERGGFYD